MTAVLLGLGANLGERAASLSAALERLRDAPGVSSLRASRYYETRPAGGPGTQQAFLNAAAVAATSLPPEALLALLHQLEAEAGRQRGERWAARELDLDLLLYGEETRTAADLLLPHPRLSFRRFVLEPAVEIAAEMIFPPTREPISALLRWLNQQPPRIALAGPPELASLTNRLAEEWRTFATSSLSPHWECLYTHAPQQLNPLPRLVVVVSDWPHLPGWLHDWRGPRLILPARSTHDEILREVLAARIAME